MVRRTEERVPLTAVTGVDVLGDWSYRPLGARAGLSVAGLFKIGTWRSPAGTVRLVCMRRGQTILRVAVNRSRSGGRFDEVLISTHDAESIARTLTEQVNS